MEKVDQHGDLKIIRFNLMKNSNVSVVPLANQIAELTSCNFTMNEDENSLIHEELTACVASFASEVYIVHRQVDLQKLID